MDFLTRLFSIPGAEEMSALQGRELLNGITEHCARHLRTVPVKEICKSPLVALAHFAEHPAGRFLHEVMLCSHKLFRQLQCVVELIVSYESQG